MLGCFSPYLYFGASLKQRKRLFFFFFFIQFLSLKTSSVFFTACGLLIFTCEDTVDGTLLPKIPSQACEAVVSKPSRALQCSELGRNAHLGHPDLLPAVSPEDSGS